MTLLDILEETLDSWQEANRRSCTAAILFGCPEGCHDREHCDLQRITEIRETIKQMINDTQPTGEPS